MLLYVTLPQKAMLRERLSSEIREILCGESGTFDFDILLLPITVCPNPGAVH